MSTETSLLQSRGGAFIVEDSNPEDVFTAEDLSPEHLAIAKAADEFFVREIQPNLDGILRQEPGVAAGVLRKSAEAGLTGVTIPERFGGLELDLISALLVAEKLGRDGSYAAWHGAHTGIGTLPVLYFGTEEQKQRYLPKLASAEWIAAYALTEPQAGSDALAARTRADLSPDGKHYILNGQKMWITNGGAADLFTVFAKVNGRDFTAFLVERAFGGVRSGAEERKMGIKGSSTTAIFFENVPVPVDNVLGEIGRGHVIAFNILNIGRLKLGVLAIGGAKDVLALSLKYAKERKAFGSAIAEFGAIQHKLAEMAIRIFAAESMAWRVVGCIERQLDGLSPEQSHSGPMLKTLEEYAIECSLIKVYGSEVLDFAADEGVQIHGGYGFHQDYAVEKAYRDSRINRIFEGTNEINRLLISGMLLKRAARGQLPLFEAARALMKKISAGTIGTNVTTRTGGLYVTGRISRYSRFRLLMSRLKKIWKSSRKSSWMSQTFSSKFMRWNLAFCALRKLIEAGKTTIAADICAVFLRDAIARIETSARNILGACSPLEMIRMHMSTLRKLAAYDPVDGVTFRRRIATHLLARERYAV